MFGDPVSMMMLATTAIGAGLKIFGASKASAAAKDESQASQQIAQDEMQINAQRKLQMELMASRQQMQNVRNVQLARSMALTSSTAQGSQFGTGLQGGFAQIGGQGNTNFLNTSQNLEIGEKIFSLDDLISQQRIRIAQDQGKMATAQGWEAIGGDIMGAGQAGGNIFGNFIKSKS